MDFEKTEKLKNRLENIKNNTLQDHEVAPDNEKKEKIKTLAKFLSPFAKAGIFWLAIEQLNAKFPGYFVHFGYWELVLFTFSISSFASLFKSK